MQALEYPTVSYVKAMKDLAVCEYGVGVTVYLWSGYELESQEMRRGLYCWVKYVVVLGVKLRKPGVFSTLTEYFPSVPHWGSLWQKASILTS